MLKKYKKLCKNKGFTLIELVIAVGLLLIVISLGYTLLFFGMRSFDTGTAQAHTQQNVRLAGDYLRSELRNAVYISDEEPGDAEDYYKFELVGGRLVRQKNTIDNDGSTENNVELVITDVLIEEVNLTFSGNILKFEISAEFDGGSYIYEDQVLLNNLSSDEYDSNIDNIPIYYKKP